LVVLVVLMRQKRIGKRDVCSDIWNMCAYYKYMWRW